MSMLVERDWPGNVRELSNAVERLVVMGEGALLDAPEVGTVVRASVFEDEEMSFASLRRAREHFEREFITASLTAHEWKIQETANALEIDRSHPWKKMKQLGISSEESDR